MVIFRENKENIALAKKIMALLPVFFLGFLFAFLPVRAEAAWDASNIISDGQFANRDSMTEAEIQSFLVSKGTFLATFTVPTNELNYYDCDSDGDGYKDDTCSVWANNIGPNNDIDSTGWTTAHLIYMSAQWYSLNPQAIISTLQKEQSLITMTTYSSYAVNWAMGYGVPDGTVRNYRYEGIAKQIDMATWQFSWNMAKANSTDLLERAKVSPYYTGNTLNICYTYLSTDCSYTYISNGATASLYRYTPYFHGNILFYNITSSWFPQVYGFSNNFDVTTSLYLSNCNPIEGQLVTASYEVKNISATAYTIRLTISDYALDAASWNSFPYQTVTLEPGASYKYSAARIVKYAGRHYAQLAFSYGTGAYGLTSSTGRLVEFSYVTNRFDQTVIDVTKSLYLSDCEPTIGDAVYASYEVANTGGIPITIDLTIVDYAVDANGWNSYPYQTVTIAAGESYKYMATRAAKYEGRHDIELAFRYNSTAYKLSSTAGNLVSFTYNTNSFNPVAILDVTKSLYLSNCDPSVGDLVYASYEVKNTSSTSITIDLTIVDYAVDANGWNSYPYQTVTIAAGENYKYMATRAAKYEGLHGAFLAFRYLGVPYNLSSSTGRLIEFNYFTK